MDINYPSNSKSGQEPKKNVEQVVTSEATSRPKPLGKRFKDLFIGGDSRTVVHQVLMDVIVPQVKDLFAEAVSQGFERLIYGDSRPHHRRPGSRGIGSSGPVNYTRYAERGNNPIGRSGREDRSPTAQVRGHGIDDILMATRVEAETVLSRMYDVLSEYDAVSVADLYSLVGWTSAYTDQNWGWKDLTGSRVDRVRNGYVLSLPRTIALD